MSAIDSSPNLFITTPLQQSTIDDLSRLETCSRLIPGNPDTIDFGTNRFRENARALASERIKNPDQGDCAGCGGVAPRSNMPAWQTLLEKCNVLKLIKQIAEKIPAYQAMLRTFFKTHPEVIGDNPDANPKEIQEVLNFANNGGIDAFTH